MNSGNNQKAYTQEEIIARLREEDYPENMLHGVCKKLQTLTPLAKEVFDKWYGSGILEDDAFDIAGYAPKTIRCLEPKIKDVGIILTFDHLVRLVQNEMTFLFENDRGKRDVAKKISFAMVTAESIEKKGRK